MATVGIKGLTNMFPQYGIQTDTALLSILYMSYCYRG